MFICINWVEWCNSAKKLMQVGHCFHAVHISFSKRRLSNIKQNGRKEYKYIQGSQILQFTKEWTEIIGQIHFYMRA